MDQILFKNAHDFLKKNFVATLATSHKSLPYASIIYYTVDEKLNLYFMTKTNTDKYFNIRSNKNVAIAVGDGPKHISVQMRGHATVLNDKRWKKRISEEMESILKKHNIENMPIRKIKELQAKKNSLDEEVIFKVIPLHLAFINLDDESLPDSISDNMHIIIPKIGR